MIFNVFKEVDYEIYGDIHSNVLVGSEDADTLWGGHGSDVLMGGRGSDTLVGGEDGVFVLPSGVCAGY